MPRFGHYYDGLGYLTCRCMTRIQHLTLRKRVFLLNFGNPVEFNKRAQVQVSSPKPPKPTLIFNCNNRIDINS